MGHALRDFGSRVEDEVPASIIARRAMAHKREALVELRARRGHDPALEELRWLLEELRVSLFAQEMRTAVPVSPTRLARLWDDLRQRAAPAHNP